MSLIRVPLPATKSHSPLGFAKKKGGQHPNPMRVGERPSGVECRRKRMTEYDNKDNTSEIRHCNVRSCPCAQICLAATTGAFISAGFALLRMADLMKINWNRPFRQAWKNYPVRYMR
jgi:hypothetical protein